VGIAVGAAVVARGRGDSAQGGRRGHLGSGSGSLTLNLDACFRPRFMYACRLSFLVFVRAAFPSGRAASRGCDHVDSTVGGR